MMREKKNQKNPTFSNPYFLKENLKNIFSLKIQIS